MLSHNPRIEPISHLYNLINFPHILPMSGAVQAHLTFLCGGLFCVKDFFSVATVLCKVLGIRNIVNLSLVISLVVVVF